MKYHLFTLEDKGAYKYKSICLVTYKIDMGYLIGLLK